MTYAIVGKFAKQAGVEKDKYADETKPSSSNDLLSAALAGTGFEKCEFEPDDDPCEYCGIRQQQLYFRSHGGYDGREGSYYCADCVIHEHSENQRAIREFGG